MTDDATHLLTPCPSCGFGVAAEAPRCADCGHALGRRRRARARAPGDAEAPTLREQEARVQAEIAAIDGRRRQLEAALAQLDRRTEAAARAGRPVAVLAEARQQVDAAIARGEALRGRYQLMRREIEVQRAINRMRLALEVERSGGTGARLSGALVTHARLDRGPAVVLAHSGMLAQGAGASLRIWDPDRGARPRGPDRKVRLPGMPWGRAAVQGLARCPDGTLLVAGRQRLYRVEPHGGRVLGEIAASEIAPLVDGAELVSVAVSPTGAVFLTAGGQVWFAALPELTGWRPTELGGVPVAFTPDGTRALAPTADGRVELSRLLPFWAPMTVRSLASRRPAISALAPDGRAVATAAEGGVAIWHEEEAERREVTLPAPAQALFFTADGTHLLVVTQGHLAIVAARSGLLVDRLALGALPAHGRWFADARAQTLYALLPAEGGRATDGQVLRFDLAGASAVMRLCAARAAWAEARAQRLAASGGGPGDEASAEGEALRRELDAWVGEAAAAVTLLLLRRGEELALRAVEPEGAAPEGLQVDPLLVLLDEIAEWRRALQADLARVAVPEAVRVRAERLGLDVLAAPARRLLERAESLLARFDEAPKATILGLEAVERALARLQAVTEAQRQLEAGALRAQIATLREEVAALTDVMVARLAGKAVGAVAPIEEDARLRALRGQLGAVAGAGAGLEADRSFAAAEAVLEAELEGLGARAQAVGSARREEMLRRLGDDLAQFSAENEALAELQSLLDE